MEIQNIEFSIGEVLAMHRHWITNLYVEERRTDVEIVGLLQERGFLVTPSQIRLCINEWGLVPREVPIAPTILPETSVDEDWEFVPSRQTSPTPSHISYTPTDADVLDHYAKKPLPSIPTSTSASTSTPTNHLIAKSKKRKAPHTDRLRVTCHHGSLPSESHEAETTLDHVPDRPTPLETYADDEQSHEILAVGLDVDSDIPVPSWRRAGEPAEGGESSTGGMRPRRMNSIRILKKKMRKSPELEKDGPVKGRESKSPECSA